LSRSQARSTGKLAPRFALVTGAAALVGAVLVVVSLGPADQRGWLFGILMSVVVGAVVGFLAYSQAGQLATRLTDLNLALGKIGRGSGGEVRVRVSGNDEVTTLGRGLQHLSADLAAMFEELDKGSGSAATMDPQVRELRDATLADPLAQPEGCELDGAIGPGSRGGLDYFGAVGDVAYVVSGEGAGPISVHACRMARDELVRALESGATARKALAHTNKSLHKRLPRGACAKASLIEIQAGQAKLYQAGFRAPLWICKAGEVFESAAEGLALGLDEGPVFEKGLRPETIDFQPGVRLVQSNDAGVRSQDLLDLVREHSPKNTSAFVNLVLGTIESDAGADGLREDVLLLTIKRVS
jgi:hypothetical protein